jgi:hypothetical protein
MERILSVSKVSLRDFERFHARRQSKPPTTPSLKELALTLLTTLVMTPFLYVTFFVIPLMGQITVGFAGLLTLIYLYYRRSVLVLIITVTGLTLFSSVTFATIQTIKYRLEIPLFVFLALGIPMSFAYCVLVGSRIWVVRGGGE